MRMAFHCKVAAAMVFAAVLMLKAQIISEPPIAKRLEHREVRHDTTVVDPYFWLREKSNPEVIRYLRDENAYTEAATQELKPFQQKLYAEMLGRIKQTDLTVPERHGDFLYYSRTEEGKQYPIHCRKKAGAGAQEEVLLDMNALALGKKFISLGTFVVSDDQNLLAYTTDTLGFRQFTLHIKDLRTGEILPDTAERVDHVQWAADNRTLLFTAEDEVTKRSDRLWRHTLGQTTHEQVFEEPDELFQIHLTKTRDRKYLLLDITSTDTTEVRYLRASQPRQPFTVFLPREKKHRYDIEHREGLFYVRTNKGAKNFQIMTAPDTDPGPENWKIFIPHDDGVLVQSIDLFHDFAVAVEKSRALNRLRVYDFKSAHWHTIQFPEPVYSVFPGSTPDYNSKTYRYSYESLVTPSSVFDYDTETGQSTLLKQQEILGGYDPSQYVSERLWAPSRDGVKIPSSVVYKKGFQRDGKAPLFLYAYGAYGSGMPPRFSSSRLSVLDRGVVYVIAHVRGGDEMGERWHEDGMLMKKKNTFYDFIDSAEYLIQEKWTSRKGLMIEGGSAGGLLMGAVVNMRPDLFRVAHIAVPFVDVMNTMMDASLPLTVGEYLEWGDPNEKAAYDYMKTYSPYDNLDKQAYPAILVTTSLHDSQVMYWEPAKYVASLRALKTDSNPLLLKIKMDPAGHGGASGRYDRLKDHAFEYAWMLSEVGITD